MRELVYPAVIYKDDEEGTNTGWYTIHVVDVGIVTEGETVEDAYVRAKEYLCAMVDCAIKFDCDIESPTDFDKIYAQYNKGKKKHIVLLVDALA